MTFGLYLALATLAVLALRWVLFVLCEDKADEDRADAPSLLEIPFDKGSKAPSADVCANLTRADIGPAPNPGRVFISDVWQTSARVDPSAKDDPSAKFAALLDRLDRALQSDLPREALGPDVIADARSSLQKAQGAGRFFVSTNGITTAAVLAAGLFR